MQTGLVSRFSHYSCIKGSTDFTLAEGYHASFGYDPFVPARFGVGAFFSQVERTGTAGEGNWVFEASFSPGTPSDAITLRTIAAIPVTPGTTYIASFLGRISNAANQCAVSMQITDDSGLGPINDAFFPINNDFVFQRYELEFTSSVYSSIAQSFVITCSNANNFPIVQLDAFDIRRKGY